MACKKVVLPAALHALDPKKMTLEDFLKAFDFSGLIMGQRRGVYYSRNKVEMVVSGNSFVPATSPVAGRAFPVAYCVGEQWNQKLCYVDDDGILWESTMTAKLLTEQKWGYNPRDYRAVTYANVVKKWDLTPWKTFRKVDAEHTQLQSDEELKAILWAKNPYVWSFVDEEMESPLLYFMAPQLETLCKAGYVFAQRIAKTFLQRLEPKTVLQFNRLTQPGKSPKEIFKTSRAVYTALKEEQDLQVWECFRKMDKAGTIPADSIKQAYDSGGLSPRILEDMRSILNRTYQGRPIFTWETLQNYLARLDLYEAIDRWEGLQILSDYLNMCHQLGIEPKTDGDSLKREHDVCARLCRQQVFNPEAAARMEKACQNLQRYNYQEQNFLIRGIRNVNDLVDEASQQRNCLASYCTYIESGSKLIFVLRETAFPDKSFATVELSPDGRTVRQMYMAYNTPVRNREAREFIERWKHVLTERGLTA